MYLLKQPKSILSPLKLAPPLLTPAPLNLTAARGKERRGKEEVVLAGEAVFDKIGVRVECFYIYYKITLVKWLS